MRTVFPCVILAVLAGCATPRTTDANAPMRAGGPNWAEVDASAERVRERNRSKSRFVETERTQEQGFRRMSDEDYAAELEGARAEVRKANAGWSDAEIEAEAVKRADEAKRRYELTVHGTARSTYEWKTP